MSSSTASVKGGGIGGGDEVITLRRSLISPTHDLRNEEPICVADEETSLCREDAEARPESPDCDGTPPPSDRPRDSLMKERKSPELPPSFSSPLAEVAVEEHVAVVRGAAAAAPTLPSSRVSAATPRPERARFARLA